MTRDEERGRALAALAAALDLSPEILEVPRVPSHYLYRRDVDLDDDSVWTVCDGCDRAMTEDQAGQPRCSFQVFCADCLAAHFDSCRVCWGASPEEVAGR